MHRPQSAPFRKALFQIHLWLAIATGLYIFMISITGSVAVFRREFTVTHWAIASQTGIRVMEWFVDLHKILLAGQLGRDINGVASILVTVLVLTGLVIWWPGRRRWRRSLVVVRPTRTHRFSWHLHSAIGFWSIVLLFGWAFTGVYFAFPEPFEWAFTYFDSDPSDRQRPGEGILLTLISWHYGRFGGLSVRILWVILGLLPAALFITGFIVWWRRVVVRAESSSRAN
jgi:uncharacterized iron-regulated membrane protein